MKKIFSIVLVCSMLILCLSGCSLFDNAKGDDPADKNDGTLVDSNSDLIKAIVSSMTEGDAERDLPTPDTAYRINLVRENGAELLEVRFDVFNYYFVCAYSDDHEINYDSYSASSECVWYTFDSADKIPEYLGGKKCVLAFQINVAASVKTLLGNDTAPKVEHFSVYKPEFKQGYNVCSPIAFDQTILYLNGVFFESVGKETVYLSSSSSYAPWATIPYVELDGAKLLLLGHDRENADEISLELALGEYYDEFSDSGKLDVYEIYLSDGSTFIYSLITLDDFVEVVKQLTAEN